MLLQNPLFLALFCCLSLGKSLAPLWAALCVVKQRCLHVCRVSSMSLFRLRSVTFAERTDIRSKYLWREIFCCICLSTVKFYMKVVCFSECEKKMDLANHGLILLQQLNAQREFGFLCDCTVAIGDVYFKAHKSVLASFSNYFKMLFVHQTR